MDREKFLFCCCCIVTIFRLALLDYFCYITGALMGNTIGMARSFLYRSLKKKGKIQIQTFLQHPKKINHKFYPLPQHHPKYNTHQTLLILQLSISRLDRLLTVFQLGVSDPSTLPVKRLETLGEDGVRVVVARIHPVRIHGAQVLDLELKEGLGELLRVSELLGEVI